MHSISNYLFTFSSSFCWGSEKAALQMTLKVTKIVAAFMEGSFEGIEKAFHTLSSTGTPLALFSSLSCYVIDHKNIDPKGWFLKGLIHSSLVKELYDYSWKDPPLSFSFKELKKRSAEIEKKLSSLEETRKLALEFKEMCPDKDPSKDIALIEEKRLEAKKTQEFLFKNFQQRSKVADLFESFFATLGIEFDEPDEDPSPAIKVRAEWIASWATIVFFGTLLSYQLDPTAHKEISLSSYIKKNLF